MTLASLIDGQLAYGLTPLLDRASFTLIAGERIGLIGRNGTGKSSLMGVLTGRVPLEAGEMHVRSGLRIALVEQEPVLPPAEGLLESLRVRGGLEDFADDRMRWRVEARLIEYMERFKLATDVAPERASGGEKKRGALALALSLDPELLLLDEPFAGMNPGENLQAADMVRRIRDNGMTVVLVEHDVPAVMRICDRIVVLDQGAKIAEGTPEQIRTDQRVVEAYLGVDTDADC